MKFQAIKGVRDILPPESALWNRVEQTACEVFGTFGFAEIRLPIFELTELFARSVGTETDIVGKEMYTFQDRPSDLPSPTPFLHPESYARAFELVLHENAALDTPENRSTLTSLKQHAFELKACESRSDIEGSERAYDLFVAALDKVLHGEVLSLRPEATASVVRAYIEHGMQTMPGNVKLYYMGPMFRRERPQKGRYRQFYQIGAEVLGSSDAPG